MLLKKLINKLTLCFKIVLKFFAVTASFFFKKLYFQKGKKNQKLHVIKKLVKN